MTQLTHVIETTPLVQGPETAVHEGCPRELLGLVCMVPEYRCLCQLVASTGVETVTSDDEAPTALRLTLNLKPGLIDPQDVVSAIAMTGYRAEFRISHSCVVATFDLTHAQNALVRSWVNDSGI